MEHFRKRACQSFSKQEKAIVLTIIKKYLHIILNVRTDKHSCGAKRNAWEKIAHKFNKHPLTPKRNALQLRQFFKTWKFLAKKKKNNHMVELNETGGSSISLLDELDVKMLEIAEKKYTEEIDLEHSDSDSDIYEELDELVKIKPMQDLNILPDNSLSTSNCQEENEKSSDSVSYHLKLISDPLCFNSQEPSSPEENETLEQYLPSVEKRTEKNAQKRSHSGEIEGTEKKSAVSKSLTDSINPREQFLLSLLPDLDEMTPAQFRKFRMVISTQIEQIVSSSE